MRARALGAFCALCMCSCALNLIKEAWGGLARGCLGNNRGICMMVFAQIEELICVSFSRVCLFY